MCGKKKIMTFLFAWHGVIQQASLCYFCLKNFRCLGSSKNNCSNIPSAMKPVPYGDLLSPLPSTDWKELSVLNEEEEDNLEGPETSSGPSYILQSCQKPCLVSQLSLVNCRTFGIKADNAIS
jgi:hypothetical protein